MANPTLSDIFRLNSTVDASSGIPILIVDLSQFDSIGLQQVTSPIAIFAAIVFSAHQWLAANNDEAVNGTSALSISSPSNRNGIDRTSFAFNVEFFNDYNSPTFEPDIT